MPQTAAELLEAANHLSQADRDWLAQELLHPPGDDLTEEEHDTAWGDEIKRRSDAIQAGTVKTYSLEEVEERLGLSLRTK